MINYYERKIKEADSNLKIATDNCDVTKIKKSTEDLNAYTSLHKSIKEKECQTL